MKKKLLEDVNKRNEEGYLADIQNLKTKIHDLKQEYKEILTEPDELKMIVNGNSLKKMKNSSQKTKKK